MAVADRASLAVALNRTRLLSARPEAIAGAPAFGRLLGRHARKRCLERRGRVARILRAASSANSAASSSVTTTASGLPAPCGGGGVERQGRRLATTATCPAGHGAWWWWGRRRGAGGCGDGRHARLNEVITPSSCFHRERRSCSCTRCQPAGSFLEVMEMQLARVLLRRAAAGAGAPRRCVWCLRCQLISQTRRQDQGS